MKLKPFSKRGVRITQFKDDLELVFGMFSKPWPRFLKRLGDVGIFYQVLGFKPFRLLVRSDLDQVLTLLSGRKQSTTRSVSKWISACVGILVLIVGFTIPLGSLDEARVKPSTLKEQKVDPCTKEEIVRAIEVDSDSQPVAFLNSSNFGGVYSGKVSCEGAEYSYTLESKGSERVLKLRKLDP